MTSTNLNVLARFGLVVRFQSSMIHQRIGRIFRTSSKSPPCKSPCLIKIHFQSPSPLVRTSQLTPYRLIILLDTLLNRIRSCILLPVPEPTNHPSMSLVMAPIKLFGILNHLFQSDIERTSTQTLLMYRITNCRK